MPLEADANPNRSRAAQGKISLGSGQDVDRDSHPALLPPEFDLYEAHLLRLGAEDRAYRFAAGAGDSQIRKHVRGIDQLRTIVLGYFENDELRGAAEIAGLHIAWPTEAELAVIVEKPWQGRGIGTQLVRRALVVARNRSCAHLHTICLIDNVRMRHIVRKFEGDMQFESGMVEGDIRLTWPTHVSLLEEACGESNALIESRLDRLHRPARD